MIRNTLLAILEILVESAIAFFKSESDLFNYIIQLFGAFDSETFKIHSIYLSGERKINDNYTERNVVIPLISKSLFVFNYFSFCFVY